MSRPANAYNYEADSNFLSLYRQFRQVISKGLGGLLPIYQVIFTPNANGTSNYQVIYNVA